MLSPFGLDLPTTSSTVNCDSTTLTTGAITTCRIIVMVGNVPATAVPSDFTVSTTIGLVSPLIAVLSGAQMQFMLTAPATAQGDVRTGVISVLLPGSADAPLLSPVSITIAADPASTKSIVYCARSSIAAGVSIGNISCSINAITATGLPTTALGDEFITSLASSVNIDSYVTSSTAATYIPIHTFYYYPPTVTSTIARIDYIVVKLKATGETLQSSPIPIIISETSASTNSIVDCVPKLINAGEQSKCTITVKDASNAAGYGHDADFSLSAISIGSYSALSSTDLGKTWIFTYFAPMDHQGIERNHTVQISIENNPIQPPAGIAIRTAADIATDHSIVSCMKSLLNVGEETICTVEAHSANYALTTFTSVDEIALTPSDTALGTVSTARELTNNNHAIKFTFTIPPALKLSTVVRTVNLNATWSAQLQQLSGSPLTFQIAAGIFSCLFVFGFLFLFLLLCVD